MNILLPLPCNQLIQSENRVIIEKLFHSHNAIVSNILHIGSIGGNGKVYCCEADKTISGSNHLPSFESPLKGLKVLLVEDDRLSCMFASRKLSGWGAQVSVADTGQEALQKFCQQTFDFVVLDLGLPDQDGFNVAKQMRALCKASDSYPLIIALSAHINQKRYRECLESGFDYVFTKPLKDDYVHVINHLFQMLELKKFS